MKIHQELIDAALFQKKVLAWFDQHGRKTLPWQQNKNPYRVWISEIMLQQTQVKTVLSYFQRFMQRFPTLEALAESTLDEVLLYWAGLGYYSRARNLHKTAQLIHARQTFPKSVKELSELPGIGRSTAGAIIAIAYDEPATILDGNVKRVLARLHAITDPVNEKKIEEQLWQFAQHYTSHERAADYTQAMMDLGATCCLPKKPQCDICPLYSDCAAAKRGIAEILPIKKRAKIKPTRRATFLMLRTENKILLQQRPAQSIWGGLWSFPELQGHARAKTIHRFCQQRFGIRTCKLNPMPAFRHSFTHYHLEILPVIVRLPKMRIKLDTLEPHIWCEYSARMSVAVPKPVQQLLSVCGV